MSNGNQCIMSYKMLHDYATNDCTISLWFVLIIRQYITHNHSGGVIYNVVASIVVDRGLEPLNQRL
jgi:hypothetical protein